jgi:CheY-like chemotaxis protein
MGRGPPGRTRITRAITRAAAGPALTAGSARDQDAAAGRDNPAARRRNRMTAARIIEAIGSLLWPLLVAVLLIRVIPHIPGVVADLRKAMRTRAFTVKVGGVELSVEDAAEQLRRQVADLQTHMAAQLAERDEPAPPAAPGAPAPPGAPAGTEAAAAPAADQGRATVLWVDDDPDANTLEVAKLRDDGLEVLLARSTAEAMDVLSLRRGVRAIVTDLSRAEEGEFRSHAGLALLRQLHEAEQDQPVLVYTSPRRVELDRQDALDAGAVTVTSSPTELFAALRRVLAAPGDRSGDPAPEPPRPTERRPRRPIRPG